MPKRSRVFRYDETAGRVVEVEKQVVFHRPHYPIACETLAVHPDEIAKTREFDRQHGVPTHYRDDGTPIMEDAGHYRRYRKLHQAHFRNAYDD